MEHIYQNYPTFNSQDIMSMPQYVMKQQIDAQAEVMKDNFRTANKMALAAQKHQLDIQKEEKRAALMEDYHKKRQLETRAISENADGGLMMELISPGERPHFSEPICPERFFRAKYFYTVDSVLDDEVLQIVWQGEEQGIFLFGDKMTAKAMGKAFLEKGVAFRVPRRAKQEILEQILSLLINRAEKIEIPRCIGWTKNSAGVWVFEKEESNTLEGMNYGG